MHYWKLLLSNWRNVEKKDGLTIPYIIGSQTYLPDNHEEQNIEQLIVDIIENSNIEIYIKYCFTTEAIILGIRDETKIKIPGRYPVFKGAPQNVLFQTTFVYDLGDDVEAIIASLIEKHQKQQINSKRYSKNNREWGDYSPDEKAFIENCFCNVKLAKEDKEQ